MTRDDASTPPRRSMRPDILTDHFLTTLREAGVVRASLFGSIARGQERPDSDVDLLVRFDHDVSFAERLMLEESLARLCGRRVELVTNLHPAFAPYILPTLTPVFL